jgi:transposase
VEWKIDASKIADCLGCDFLPERHMASTAIRDRRRLLRYRHLLVRQTVQTRNRVSGLLPQTGAGHKKSRLYRVRYFRRLMTMSSEGQHPDTTPAEPGDHRVLPED